MQLIRSLTQFSQSMFRFFESLGPILKSFEWQRPKLTSFECWRPVFLSAGLLFVLGCTVKLAEDTPGAKSSCAQSPAVINEFYCSVFQQSIVGASPQGCTGCHVTGAAGGNAMRFDISKGFGCCPNCAAQFPAEVQANFCTAFLEGNKLIEYPQSDSHSAAAGIAPYTESQLSNLADWVNQYH